LGDETLEGNARRVLQYIRDHPACHLRLIRNDLKISMGTVQYHLRHLERARDITSNRLGLLKHYFQSGVFQDNEKNLLEVLSHETARDILMFIIERGNPTQSDIAARFGVSAPSISWHVRRLADRKVITDVRDGKYKRYQLRGDPKPLVSLMKSYYPSLWDRWSSRLAEIFLSLSRGEKQ
jgi:predicted transcriptional regulator